MKLIIYISLYIIIVKFFPSFYWDEVYPYLGDYTKEIAYDLLNKGYGVPIGGSITYADYIISISIFLNFSRIMFGKDRKKLSIWFIVKMVIFVTAIWFENRRSEIIALLMTFLILYVMSLDTRRAVDFFKKIRGLIIITVLIIATLIIISRTGFVSRFEEVFQKIILRETHSQDVTGGRFVLWFNAWNLFKSNPVRGIGWEQFINYNRYRHDVHNTYLQWLCESGIVGFVLIMILLKQPG